MSAADVTAAAADGACVDVATYRFTQSYDTIQHDSSITATPQAEVHHV